MYMTTASLAHQALACRWLRTCSQSHPECNPRLIFKPPPGRLLELDASNESIIRLVETRLRFPSTTHFNIEYCCLTHRWGSSSNVIKLLSSNINQFQKSIAVESLPTSYRDAVTISRGLGILYLWIDSLCIIQNSDEDWLTESRKMDCIFEGAACTIAAAGSEDSHGGCFKFRDPLAVSKCRLPNSRIYVSADETSFLNISEATSETPLSKRGWIFQERLLSHRTLTFGHRGLFWHCGRGAATEQDPDGWGLINDYSAYVDKIFDASNASTSDWKPWPQGFTFASKTFFDSLITRQWTNWERKPDPNSAYCFHRDWMSIVAAYSGCQLTQIADKLHALAGIVNRVKGHGFSADLFFARVYPQVYFNGVWSPTIMLDILWQRDGSDDKSFSINPGVPSWSWASINGRVKSALLAYPADVVIEAMNRPMASYIQNTMGSELWLNAHLLPAKVNQEQASVSIQVDGIFGELACYLDDPFNPVTSCYFLPVLRQSQIDLGLLVNRGDNDVDDQRTYRRIGLATRLGRHLRPSGEASFITLSNIPRCVQLR